MAVFLAFPDVESGRKALRFLLKSEGYQKCTIKRAIEAYAPRSDSNRTDHYIASVKKALPEIKDDGLLKDFSDEQFERIVKAIEKEEGFYGVHAKGKEYWLKPPVHIALVEKTGAPIANKTVKVVAAGNAKIVKTNEQGAIPTQWVPKGDSGKISVFIQRLNGEFKKLGDVIADGTQKFVHVTSPKSKSKSQTEVHKGKPSNVAGASKPVTAPTAPSGGVSPSVTPNDRTGKSDIYEVKRGDTLTKIAALFGTTATELARLNNISNINVISVGQQLVVKEKNCGDAD